MKKQITSIIIGIFLISLSSALAYNITAGESMPIALSESYDYYSVVGNSTPIDLNITQEGTIVTIQTSKYMSSNSFEIIFFNKEKEIIKEVHHYSSGGSSTRKVYVENKTIEYVNVTIPYNQTDIIYLTPEDLIPEEKGWLGKFWEWIKSIFTS